MIVSGAVLILLRRYGSRKEAAKQMDIAPACLSDVLNRRRPPSPYEKERLAKVFTANQMQKYFMKRTSPRMEGLTYSSLRRKRVMRRMVGNSRFIV